MLSDNVLVELIRLITGVLKSNEVYNANYLVHYGTLYMELHETALYSIDCSDVIKDNNYIIFNIVNNGPTDKFKVVYNSNALLSVRLINYSRTYELSTMNSMINCADNLEQDPVYSELLKLKADQGMKFYKLYSKNNLQRMVYIPVFSGFPNLNKGDTISVEVYPDKDYAGYLIVVYTIYKHRIKKSCKMYFRIIGLV